MRRGGLYLVVCQYVIVGTGDKGGIWFDMVNDFDWFLFFSEFDMGSLLGFAS